MDRGVAHLDALGVDLELLGEQRREAGRGALSHLDLVELQDDPVVGRDLEPGVEGRAVEGALGRERDSALADHTAGEEAAGRDARALEERPPADPRHHAPSLWSSAARCMAARIRL